MSTGTNSRFPKARTADLITERVGNELVVYDGTSSEAHCLSALASAVFMAADGKTSSADLAAMASRELNELVDVPTVEQALVELEDRGLVEVGGISRRGFMQRSAAVGGAAFAATMVTSVVAPAVGQATSLPVGPPCNGYSSLAIQIENNGCYYGAHWAQGSANGSVPTDFGATQANSAAWGPKKQYKGCPTTPWTVTNSGWPTGVAEPVLQYISGGFCISLPTGYTITEWAAFFGGGATGTCGQQCLTGGTPPVKSCGYVVTFDASCYQGC